MDGDVRPTTWPSDAGADQWETALMVLGRSIGTARIGESEDDVVAFYGPPRRRTKVVVGKQRLERLIYRVHGGSLWMMVDNGVVVGVGTDTPYYTTPKGIGVGANPAVVRSWAG